MRALKSQDRARVLEEEKRYKIKHNQHKNVQQEEDCDYRLQRKKNLVPEVNSSHLNLQFKPAEFVRGFGVAATWDTDAHTEHLQACTTEIERTECTFKSMHRPTI